MRTASFHSARASSSTAGCLSYGEEKLIPFGWYGGNSHILTGCCRCCRIVTTTCEPFAGSAVLLNRDPSPVETFNDLDGEV